MRKPALLGFLLVAVGCLFAPAHAAAQSAIAGTARDTTGAVLPGVTVEVRSDAVWSRVQLGSFATRTEAQRFAARLAARGFPAVVVPLALVDADLALAWRLAEGGAPAATSGP